MRTQSPDTTPEAEQVLIGLIRNASFPKRFSLVRSLTHHSSESFLQVLGAHHPTANEQEIASRFVAHHAGQFLAETFQEVVAQRPGWKRQPADLLAAMLPLRDACEHFHLAYALGGSLASSLYGMQQAARDIDVVVRLPYEQREALLRHLQQAYVIDTRGINSAPGELTRLTLLHLGTLLPVDVIVPASSLFEEAMRERVQEHLLEEGTRPFVVASAEEMILHQLQRYQREGEVADDQWNALLGVCKVQGRALDRACLWRWADILEVTDLLEQALVDAGLEQDEARATSPPRPAHA